MNTTTHAKNAGQTIAAACKKPSVASAVIGSLALAATVFAFSSSPSNAFSGMVSSKALIMGQCTMSEMASTGAALHLTGYQPVSAPQRTVNVVKTQRNLVISMNEANHKEILELDIIHNDEETIVASGSDEGHILAVMEKNDPAVSRRMGAFSGGTITLANASGTASLLLDCN